MWIGREMQRVAMAAALAGAVAGPCLAERIVVPPGDGVQAALDRSRPGDVIVLEGEHRGPVHVTRGVTLEGAPGSVLIGDGHSQAASMVIAPGDREGGPENRHAHADQWLYIESGAGEAIINGHTYPLEAGALVLIQRGDTHEIRNTGRTPLKTLNFYVPPAYTASGEELPAGRAA